jgi:hypothetical protein
MNRAATFVFILLLVPVPLLLAQDAATRKNAARERYLAFQMFSGASETPPGAMDEALAKCVKQYSSLRWQRRGYPPRSGESATAGTLLKRGKIDEASDLVDEVLLITK